MKIMTLSKISNFKCIKIINKLSQSLNNTKNKLSQSLNNTKNKLSQSPSNTKNKLSQSPSNTKNKNKHYLNKSSLNTG